MRHDRNGLIRCRVCGCTAIDACNPPCGWAQQDLCTTCADAVKALLEWADAARRANLSGLLQFNAQSRNIRPALQLTEKGRAFLAGHR